MLKVLGGCLLLLLSQTLVWFQIYGPLKIESLKNNHLFIYGVAIPITFFFYHGVRMTTETFGGSMWVSRFIAFSTFGGSMWVSRFIAFSMGIISFTILTWYFNGEGITLKTGITLLLSIIIVSIQIFWK
jgi:hypothetical protein